MTDGYRKLRNFIKDCGSGAVNTWLGGFNNHAEALMIFKEFLNNNIKDNHFYCVSLGISDPDKMDLVHKIYRIPEIEKYLTKHEINSIEKI